MNISYLQPLISCICITDNRVNLLQRAIECYKSQDYPNKQLVVSFPQDDMNTATFIQNICANSNINLLKIIRENGQTVGEARNTAISLCNGEYICVWDDDDWYHENRISYQFQRMNQSINTQNASVLTTVVLADMLSKQSYQSSYYTWENTLLCRKEIVLQNPYAQRNKSEDTHIIQFLEKKKFLFHVDDAPYLYVYIFHGTNTWSYDHFQILLKKALPLDAETNKIVFNRITQ